MGCHVLFMDFKGHGNKGWTLALLYLNKYGWALEEGFINVLVLVYNYMT